MTFADIEARRKQAGISQYALCRRAEVAFTTYYRRLRDDGGDGRARQRTINKLNHALTAMIREKAA